MRIHGVVRPWRLRQREREREAGPISGREIEKLKVLISWSEHVGRAKLVSTFLWATTIKTSLLISPRWIMNDIYFLLFYPLYDYKCISRMRNFTSGTLPNNWNKGIFVLLLPPICASAKFTMNLFVFKASILKVSRLLWLDNRSMVRSLYGDFRNGEIELAINDITSTDVQQRRILLLPRRKKKKDT